MPHLPYLSSMCHVYVCVTVGWSPPSSPRGCRVGTQKRADLVPQVERPAPPTTVLTRALPCMDPSLFKSGGAAIRLL